MRALAYLALSAQLAGAEEVKSLERSCDAAVSVIPYPCTGYEVEEALEQYPDSCTSATKLSPDSIVPITIVIRNNCQDRVRLPPPRTGARAIVGPAGPDPPPPVQNVVPVRFVAGEGQTGETITVTYTCEPFSSNCGQPVDSD